MKKILFFGILIATTSCYEEEKLLELTGELSSVEIYLEKENVRLRRTYQYNSFGKVAREQRFDPDGKETGEINFIYNDKQQLKEAISTISDYRYEEYYNYDEKGRLTNISGNGRADLSDYIYDQYDRLVEKHSYHFVIQEKIYLSKNIYNYDKVNLYNIYEESLYRTKSEDTTSVLLEEKLQYLYDDDGKLIQKKLIDGRNIFHRGTKEFFEYDSKGRLYKKLEYGLDLNFSHLFGLLQTWTYHYYE